MINISKFASHSIAFIIDSLKRPLKVELNAHQKKIALIALAVFVYMAACTIVTCFCFIAKKATHKKKRNSPREQAQMINKVKVHPQIPNQPTEPKKVKELQEFELEEEDLEVEIVMHPARTFPEVPFQIKEVQAKLTVDTAQTADEAAVAVKDESNQSEPAIKILPEEILTAIFHFLPASYRPALVSKQWKQVYDQVNPIKLIQSGQFFKALKDHSLSHHAKDQQEYLRWQLAIQGNSPTPWMNVWMQRCSSPEEQECIWQNLLLSFFSIDESISHPKIQKVMNFLNQRKISLYEPKEHLEEVLLYLSEEERMSITEVIKDALRLDYLSDQMMEFLLRNPTFWPCLIQKFGWFLLHIPEDKRTESLCLSAVRQNGWALKHVPKDKQSEEICLAAVRQNGWALKHVTEEMRSEKLFFEALRQKGNALQYVPEDKRTDELYLAAIQKNGRALEFVPYDKRTEDLCLAAVQQKGYAFKAVPLDKQSNEICLAAVKAYGLILKSIPIDKQTEDIYLAAVQQKGKALQYVPEDKRTDELYLEAVKHGFYFDEIPENKRSEELCLAAYKEDFTAFTYIPEEKLTKEFCFEAVQQNVWVIEYIPEDKLTEELCLAAVQQNGMTLDDVPEDQRTEEICIAAVQQDGMALQFVPEDKLTEEICLAAVEQHGWALQFVPEEKLTEKICLAAVQQDGRALRFVPEDRKSIKLCLAAALRLPTNTE